MLIERKAVLPVMVISTCAWATLAASEPLRRARSVLVLFISEGSVLSEGWCVVFVVRLEWSFAWSRGHGGAGSRRRLHTVDALRTARRVGNSLGRAVAGHRGRERRPGAAQDIAEPQPVGGAVGRAE